MPELGMSGSVGGPGPATAQVYPTPAEDFFDPPADFLTGDVPRSTGGPSVHGAASARDVLGDVGCDTLGAQRLHTFIRVVALVGTERLGMKAAHASVVDQVWDHVSFSRASRHRHLEVHQ